MNSINLFCYIRNIKYRDLVHKKKLIADCVPNQNTIVAYWKNRVIHPSWKTLESVLLHLPWNTHVHNSRKKTSALSQALKDSPAEGTTAFSAVNRVLLAQCREVSGRKWRYCLAKYIVLGKISYNSALCRSPERKYANASVRSPGNFSDPSGRLLCCRLWCPRRPKGMENSV